MTETKKNLVFFGIEISDYEPDCDILQIIMKCGSATFNKYIDPTKPIAKAMTKVNCLTIRNSQLCRGNVVKRSRPLLSVMKELLKFLKDLDRPCTLLDHKYCYKSSARLMSAIKETSMETEFSSIIDGFTSTYELFKEKFPDKDPEELTLHKLAKEIDLVSTHPFKSGRSIRHNAVLLEKLTLRRFRAEELYTRRSFCCEMKRCERFQAQCPKVEADEGSGTKPKVLSSEDQSKSNKQKEEIKRSEDLQKAPEKERAKKKSSIKKDRKIVKISVAEDDENDFCTVAVRMRIRRKINSSNIDY